MWRIVVVNTVILPLANTHNRTPHTLHPPHITWTTVDATREWTQINMVLTQWPPKNGHFETGWFYICITIGEPLRRELRPYRHQELLHQLEHEDWESYIPDNPWEDMGMLFKTKCRDEFSGQLGLVEGISKSRTLMFSEYLRAAFHPWVSAW